MTVRQFRLTNHALKAPMFSWQTQVDANLQVVSTAAAFSPHESTPPGMTVTIQAGSLFVNGALVNVPAQTLNFTAPVTNPRIDRIVIDQGTGIASVVTGVEAVNPVPPAIPAGKIPIAQVRLEPGVTAITNAMITDERTLWSNPEPVLGTPVPATSGASIDFTSIPPWVRKITVMFSGVSVTGADNVIIQIGDSGGIETTGYSSVSASIINGSAPTVVAATNGYLILAGVLGSIRQGIMELDLLDSSTNMWVAQGVFARTDSPRSITCTGEKSLSATLDRVRITTTGVNTFNGGIINIRYEY